MAKTFEQSLDEIARLVRHYQTNRAAFHAPGYKEAHARQNLIDPLFIALDWDVYNTGRAAPQYQPVVLEDSLDVEGGKKAPDYAFRIGRDTVFFAEAKKPSVSIKTDPDPAYQLRRYAWSAKLPLSLLTDFEEMAVYDCRKRPSAKDKVSAGRISYLSFEEYPDRWRELWDVFSYDAVPLRLVRPIRANGQRQARHERGRRRVPEGDRALARRAGAQHRAAQPAPGHRRVERRRAAHHRPARLRALRPERRGNPHRRREYPVTSLRGAERRSNTSGAVLPSPSQDEMASRVYFTLGASFAS
jgi:hypothetical protein